MKGRGPAAHASAERRPGGGSVRRGRSQSPTPPQGALRVSSCRAAAGGASVVIVGSHRGIAAVSKTVNHTYPFYAFSGECSSHLNVRISLSEKLAAYVILKA